MSAIPDWIFVVAALAALGGFPLVLRLLDVRKW